MTEGPLKHREVDAVAKRNLTLAGFTLTALSIMIGFYRDDLFGAGPIIPSLLTARSYSFSVHNLVMRQSILAKPICQTSVNPLAQ